MNNTELTTESTIQSKAGSLLKWAVENTLDKNWKSERLGMVYFLSIEHYRKGVLYDKMLKIGYTANRSIESRIAWLPTCFTVTVLSTAIMPRDMALATEQDIHKYFKSYRYHPKHSKWSGANEVYKTDMLSTFPTLNSIIDKLPDMIKATSISTPSNLN
jgi:hypothetical protein